MEVEGQQRLLKHFYLPFDLVSEWNLDAALRKRTRPPPQKQLKEGYISQPSADEGKLN